MSVASDISSGVSANGIVIRSARLSDIDAIVALHREAFADTFGAAFGPHGGERGAQALAVGWRRQGAAALQGMFVAEYDNQVIGTTSLRTRDMMSGGGFAESAFFEILGWWGRFAHSSRYRYSITRSGTVKGLLPMLRSHRPGADAG